MAESGLPRFICQSRRSKHSHLRVLSFVAASPQAAQLGCSYPLSCRRVLAILSVCFETWTYESRKLRRTCFQLTRIAWTTCNIRHLRTRFRFGHHSPTWLPDPRPDIAAPENRARPRPQSKQTNDSDYFPWSSFRSFLPLGRKDKHCGMSYFRAYYLPLDSARIAL
ncbi:hypothetical protein GGR57DRAFT_473676 [Xylariaceae sp. FL1272]|nr:hypothetical protein GGR57DRAFT_473676 [Xylariaceae sp. FL1272]